MKKGYDAYRTVNIDTASQGKLILIAYDVAIKHCKLALESFASSKEMTQRSKYLFKAQDAIAELMSALNMEVGEIAQNLYRLYDYMLRRLVESNVKNEQSFTEEVLHHLENLRGAWEDAIEQVKRGDGGQAAVANDAASAPQQGFAVSG